MQNLPTEIWCCVLKHFSKFSDWKKIWSVNKFLRSICPTTLFLRKDDIFVVRNLRKRFNKIQKIIVSDSFLFFYSIDDLKWIKQSELIFDKMPTFFMDFRFKKNLPNFISIMSYIVFENFKRNLNLDGQYYNSESNILLYSHQKVYYAPIKMHIFGFKHNELDFVFSCGFRRELTWGYDYFQSYFDSDPSVLLTEQLEILAPQISNLFFPKEGKVNRLELMFQKLTNDVVPKFVSQTSLQEMAHVYTHTDLSSANSINYSLSVIYKLKICNEEISRAFITRYNYIEKLKWEQRKFGIDRYNELIQLFDPEVLVQFLKLGIGSLKSTFKTI